MPGKTSSLPFYTSLLNYVIETDSVNKLTIGYSSDCSDWSGYVWMFKKNSLTSIELTQFEPLRSYSRHGADIFMRLTISHFYDRKVEPLFFAIFGRSDVL